MENTILVLQDDKPDGGSYSIKCPYRHLTTMGGVCVCPSIFSSTVHVFDFTLGVCVAKGPRKCIVECEVLCIGGSR